jgi:hypothetical protein
MQHGHGQAAWIGTCSIDITRQHGHVHAAWIWTCSIDTDMQHGHGHAAWTWTCRIDMDKQHGHRRAAWTRTCSMIINMQHRHGQAEWTWMRSADVNLRCSIGLRHEKKTEVENLILLSLSINLNSERWKRTEVCHECGTWKDWNKTNQFSPSLGDAETKRGE